MSEDRPERTDDELLLALCVHISSGGKYKDFCEREGLSDFDNFRLQSLPQATEKLRQAHQMRARQLKDKLEAFREGILDGSQKLSPELKSVMYSMESEIKYMGGLEAEKPNARKAAAKDTGDTAGRLERAQKRLAEKEAEEG
jgi:hypothetical protein